MVRHVILLIALIAASCASAQKYKLSKYTNSDGLPQNYIYTLSQDQDGFVWIGLAEGLVRYDGVNFVMFTTRDSLADNYVNTSITDQNGYLWLGHGNGLITRGKNSQFEKVRVPDVAAPIKGMCTDDLGNIWAVEQSKGLIKVAPDKTVTTYFDRKLFGRRIFNCVCAINSMQIVIGTSDGALLVKINSRGEVSNVEEIGDLPYASISCIEKSIEKQTWLVGTEEGELYKYAPDRGGQQVYLYDPMAGPEPNNIRSIYENEKGEIFTATWGQGVKQWRKNEEAGNYEICLYLNDNNGLANNYITDIMCDREGVLWFASYGSGVLAWVNNYFSEYDLSAIGIQHKRVSCTALDEEGNIWAGLSNGLVVRMNKTNILDYDIYSPQNGLPQLRAVTSIAFDYKNGVQYVGTEADGIFYRPFGETVFRPYEYSTLSRTCLMVKDIKIVDEYMYVATQGGFIVCDLLNHGSNCFTTIDGLPHNNINFLFVDNDKHVWFGSKDSGIAMLNDDGTFSLHRLADFPVDVVGMSVDSYNRFWLATSSNGVLCMNNDTTVSITIADGLEKNYCFSSAIDGNNRLWVCHQPGLSCIDLHSGNIRAFNHTNGLGLEFSHVSRDTNGDLWFSSDQGLVRYACEFDRRATTPPTINLTKLLINGKKHNIAKPIDLPYPYTDDPAKFEFDFVGICMKDPKSVRYEYWLETEDSKYEKWEQLGTLGRKDFDYLPSGDHKLHIRAFNSDGVVCREPLMIEIHIDKPFWQSWLFILFAVLCLYILFRVFSHLREKQLLERQRELEREIDKQTVELRQQKNQIEEINKEVMDSIAYANRIQTAILPPIEYGLKDVGFSNSFILFIPRDIVSGDFYWFQRFGDKALVCAGDCTGHGVPGAFMSMIVTALLNEATHDSELVLHPGKLLTAIDKEIKNTLNKNRSVEAEDGMDCALMLFDFKTYDAVFAGAHRPVYVVSREQLTEIRGTARGVGERHNDNEFMETPIKLREGDMVYLTSDGYASQFEDGKIGVKYTAGRLKRFLTKISTLPVDKQHEKLEEEFLTFRGDQSKVKKQIDDVIVMGIKL